VTSTPAWTRSFERVRSGGISFGPGATRRSEGPELEQMIEEINAEKAGNEKRNRAVQIERFSV
jgi:hypothetical protein